MMTLHEVSGFELEDVVGTFCCYVSFFASEDAARDFASTADDRAPMRMPSDFRFRGNAGLFITGSQTLQMDDKEESG